MTITPLFTRRVIFALVAVIAIYDIVAAALGGAGSTISLQIFGMTGYQVRHVTLIFAFGYFMGHMIGRIDVDKGTP